MHFELRIFFKVAEIFLIGVLCAITVSAKGPTERSAAPKGGITAVYQPATGLLSFVDSQGRATFTQEYLAGTDGPGSGRWSASGRFFVYPVLDPVRTGTPYDQFHIADAKTHRIFMGDELLVTGNPTSSKFELSKDDTITFYEVDLGHKNRLVPHTLSLLKRLLSLGDEPIETLSEVESEHLYREWSNAQKTGICNVHRIRMQKEAVPIRWGFVEFDPVYEPAQFRHFPNAQEYILGGCVVDEKKVGKTVPIYVCPECMRAKKVWLAHHKHKSEEPLMSIHKNI